MKNKLYSPQWFILLVLLLTPFVHQAQISGNVFRDVNNDGIRQVSYPTEPGEAGIVVKVFNASNVLLATVTTNASGNFSFTAAQAAAGTSVRVEFILTAGNYPSKRINSNRSNIQFLVAGPAAVNIDFAVASKQLVSSNGNPYLATTAYTNGDANGIGGANNAGQYNNLYVFPYDMASDGGTGRRVQNKHLGALFGLAWQKESRTLLMSAYLKRHCSFGPDGMGAIYKSQISSTGNPSTPALLVNVSSIGINVGTNPRSATLPTNATTPNTDNGVFANIGKMGIGGIELSADGRELYIINMFEKKLQRINIGNPLKSSFSAADVTGSWAIPDPLLTGTSWRPMAIKQKNNKFYIGGITTKETTSAHSFVDTVNLRGIVYEFNPSTNTFTEVLRFPLSHRRGFVNADYRYANRNNYWSGWQNSGDISLGGPLRTGLIGSLVGSNATGIYYPQPMFSAIEFDIDGSMIIGIRDRFGDQGGYANFFETGNVPGDTYRTLATGEVLRAGINGNTWDFENAGTVTSNGVSTTTAGATSNNPLLTGSFPGMTGTPWGGIYGPGGKYYYYNFNFSTSNVPAPFNVGATVTSHYLKSNGGLAYVPGYNEVVTTAIDPMNQSYTNGLIKNVNLGAQAGNMSARMNLITSSGADAAGMGKAAALGDLEVLTDAQAMEIGNRVWEDKNFNGIQDANEPGIAGVKVDLRSPGADSIYNTADDQKWTVTTDAEGHYYFDQAIVNDNRRPATWIGVSATNSGVLPGFEYRLEILTTQTPLLSHLLTTANASYTEVSSKGSYTGPYVYHVINAGGTSAAGSSFENNYNIDFGFYTYAILPVNKLDVSATLNANIATINWKTVNESSVNFYGLERSSNGINFTGVANTLSKGNGSFNYSYADDITNVNSNFIYYRLKVVGENEKITYSQTVKVAVNSLVKVAVMPNPFSSYINVSFTVSKKGTVAVTVINTSGQKVYSNSFAVAKGTSSFNYNEFANLPKGIYVVIVTTQAGTQQQKLLKQ
jgi:trimeric autotransporter adhesin